MSGEIEGRFGREGEIGREWRGKEGGRKGGRKGEGDRGRGRGRRRELETETEA